jgi:hypothetical protein
MGVTHSIVREDFAEFSNHESLKSKVGLYNVTETHVNKQGKLVITDTGIICRGGGGYMRCIVC